MAMKLDAARVRPNLLRNSIASRAAVLTVALVVNAITPIVPVHAQSTVLGLGQTVRIDGEKANLVPITELAIGPHGIIAVTQEMARSVRFFNSDGSSIGTFGRNGDGPGEFRRVSQLGWSGDSLWVMDGDLRRITLMSEKGDILRTEPFPNEARPLARDIDRFPEFRTVRSEGRVPGGSFIAWVGQPAAGPVSAAWRSTLSYFHIAADGSILNFVASRPDDTNDERYAYYHTFPDGSRRGRQFPFAALPQYDVSSDGQRFAVVNVGGSTPATASVRVTMIRSDGDTIYSAAYFVPAITLPASVADSAVSVVVASLSTGGGGMAPASWTGPALRAAAAAWERRAQAHMPAFYPPVEGGAVIGRDGSVWIPLRQIQQGRPYLVLDSVGNAIAQPVFPRDIRVLDADTDAVWGVETDEYDVPSIVRYRLSKRNM